MPASPGSAPEPRPTTVGSAAPATATAGRANGRPEFTPEREHRRFPLPRLTLRRGAAPAPAPADELIDDAETDDGGEADWRSIGIFGAGLLLGTLIGAGTALLLAPATGFETRARLVQRARMAGEGAADRWDDIEDRVRQGARRSRRKLERKIAMSRWRAQDAWERKRYGRA